MPGRSLVIELPISTGRDDTTSFINCRLRLRLCGQPSSGSGSGSGFGRWISLLRRRVVVSHLKHRARAPTRPLEDIRRHPTTTTTVRPSSIHKFLPTLRAQIPVEICFRIRTNNCTRCLASSQKMCTLKYLSPSPPSYTCCVLLHHARC